MNLKKCDIWKLVLLFTIFGSTQAFPQLDYNSPSPRKHGLFIKTNLFQYAWMATEPDMIMTAYSIGVEKHFRLNSLSIYTAGRRWDRPEGFYDYSNWVLEYRHFELNTEYYKNIGYWGIYCKNTIYEEVNFDWSGGNGEVEDQVKSPKITLGGMLGKQFLINPFEIDVYLGLGLTYEPLMTSSLVFFPDKPYYIDGRVGLSIGFDIFHRFIKKKMVAE